MYATGLETFEETGARDLLLSRPRPVTRSRAAAIVLPLDLLDHKRGILPWQQHPLPALFSRYLNIRFFSASTIVQIYSASTSRKQIHNCVYVCKTDLCSARKQNRLFAAIIYIYVYMC